MPSRIDDTRVLNEIALARDYRVLMTGIEFVSHDFGMNKRGHS